MLLRLKRRKHATMSDGDESGVALIAVIGIMAVVALIAVSIATSAIAASSFTSSTRASIQARAAADAGIDTAWAAMNHGTFRCAVPSVSDTSFSTVVGYFNAAGAALTCSAGSGVVGTPAKAVVTSTGFAKNPGVGGDHSGNERTITALFDIVVNSGVVNLDKAVFSEGPMTLTNDLNVTDPLNAAKANLYSNGNLSCAASGPKIQGSVSIQGSFFGPNRCEVTGSVWAAGTVDVTSQVKIGGDVYSAGGPGPAAAQVKLDTAFVNGTVVANGGVSINGNSNEQYCSLNAYNAKVCGSVISIDGGISLSNGAKVGGGAYARNTVDIGSTNETRMVGGNVVSSHGNLIGSNFGNNGYRVGGYVAVGGSSALLKARIGNPASSCAATAGFSVCNPVRPIFPAEAVPAALNFPTNSRVVAPPRESLPRMNMYPDSSIASKWAGWTVQHVPCADAKTRISNGAVGKLLLIVDGCTDPLTWNNATLVLRGDLAVMSPSGFATSNDFKVKTSSSGATHDLMWIVPSDAKKGAGNVASWQAPIPAEPTYTKPTCAAGDAYGDVRVGKVTLQQINWFIYTPCDVEMSQPVTGFRGQIYAGTTALPNNSTLEMKKMSVPGVTSSTGSAASVTATQTARFDARDGG